MIYNRLTMQVFQAIGLKYYNNVQATNTYARTVRLKRDARTLETKFCILCTCSSVARAFMKTYGIFFFNADKREMVDLTALTAAAAQ